MSTDLASCSANDKENQVENDIGEEINTGKKKWERFSSWIHCICVVTFDLELGQAIETIYPSHVKLTEQERSNVCYLAFPDSNSGCMGDTQYHVRIRQNAKTSQNSESLKEYDRKCPVFVQCDKDYYWGYVYFRQVKDKTLPRGYFQKSIVIMTKLPLVNLFSEICALVAPEFFETGTTVMEVVSREIDRWPPPVPGQILHLTLMGVLFQTYIPNQNYKATVPTVAALDHVSNKHSLRKIVLTSAYEGDMFRSLASVVSHVHLLWELALLGEPIVVMASSPTTCSEMVQALTATIAPLKYCADHRPYFTIHDSEFKEYTTDAPSPPAVILGVTNPFFAKTLQHWPHIIRITNGSSAVISDIVLTKGPVFLIFGYVLYLGGPYGGFKFPDTAATAAILKKRDEKSLFLLYLVNENQKYRIKKSENLKVLDSKPGVYTQYKPFLQKDKAILKKLLRGIQTKRPGEVQTALLRRHLLELTESFMIPLERYIASLMPLQKNISPFKATPIPQLFNPDDFLATLSSAGPQLTIGIKGDWVGLYRRFFRSPNFSGWFHTRYMELTQKLQAIQLEALSQADLKTWVQGKQEVEVVDMILRIRQKLDKSYEDDVPIGRSIQEKLSERINDIIYTLPDDLQIILSVKS